MNIPSLAQEYRCKGYIPFPLAPGSKEPLRGSKLATVEQLKFTDTNNIGLFPGSENGLIVIDCDSETSQVNVASKLQEMGLLGVTTIVQSPRRQGRHMWLRVLDVPSEAKCSYALPADIGQGEFRLHRNAYVVAPGSTLPEGKYCFLQGGLHEFLNQPVVLWRDLAWLLEGKGTTGRGVETSNTPLSLPIRLLYNDRPKAALSLAEKLRGASRKDFIPWCRSGKTGDEQKGYRGTSEAEAGLITMLILAGWCYEQIEVLFDSIASPHYKEEGKKYLLHSFNNAVDNLCNDVIRKQVAEWYQYAATMPWPGFSGGDDRKALLAILSKAWEFKTVQPAVSYREISRHAGFSLPTSQKASPRLQTLGFLRMLTSDKKGDTQRYDLSLFESVKTLYISQGGRTVTNVKNLDTWAQISEIWGRGFLGPSAGLIFPHLSLTDPIAESELMNITGKVRNTIKAALARLFEWGLAEPVGNGYWLRGQTDLAEVAEEMGAIERAGKRRAQHRTEIEAYQRWKQQIKQQLEHMVEETGE